MKELRFENLDYVGGILGCEVSRRKWGKAPKVVKVVGEVRSMEYYFKSEENGAMMYESKDGNLLELCWGW